MRSPNFLNFYSDTWQNKYEEEKANAEIVRQEQQKQRRKREIERLQQKLIYHKQACRCRFGICNGRTKIMSHKQSYHGFYLF